MMMTGLWGIRRKHQGGGGAARHLVKHKVLLTDAQCKVRGMKHESRLCRARILKKGKCRICEGGSLARRHYVWSLLVLLVDKNTKMRGAESSQTEKVPPKDPFHRSPLYLLQKKSPRRCFNLQRDLAKTKSYNEPAILKHYEDPFV